MNSTDHGEGSLKNFYGYKETFAKETTWVHVPQELKFVHTNNPYEDDEEGGYIDHDGGFVNELGERLEEGSGAPDYEFARQLAKAAYPAYATQGLEALSAVASQDQYSYAPPPAPMAYSEHVPIQQESKASPQQSHATASQNLDYILNPAAAGAVNNSNIDPRLHSEISMPQSSGANDAQSQSPVYVRKVSMF